MAANDALDTDPQYWEQMVGMAKVVLDMLGEKDSRVKEHSKRVANNSANFCEAFDLLRGEELRHLYIAGLVHDSGYVSIPNQFIGNKQALSDEEMLLIKKHPVVGANILSNHQGFVAVLPLVRHHHEAFDGKGYPDGRRGEDIPFGARVLHLFDYYDQLTSGLTKDRGLTKEEALADIHEKTGQEFDPALISRFIQFVESNSGVSDDFLIKKQTAFIKQSFAAILNKFSTGEIVPPAMPQVVLEFKNVIKRDDATIKTLADVLVKDPVISLRLISIARSPVYKGYGDVKNVQSAIPRLGFKETLSIVVAIANKSLYEAKHPQHRMLLDKMWVHSLACAYTSKSIAQILSLPDPETMFLMGLTHDVGKVILLRAFAELPQPNSLKSDVIITAIQDAHQSLGSMFLKRWRFGEEFLRVVILHEGSNFTEQTNKEILVVHLANMMTRKMGFSFFEWDGKGPAELLSAQLLGLSSEAIERVEKTVKTIMLDVAHLF